MKATPLWLSTDKQHNLTHIPLILWPLNNPSLESIYSSRPRCVWVFKGGKLASCPVRTEASRHTSGPTSGTNSLRFWLLCSPAGSYLLQTTTCDPPASQHDGPTTEWHWHSLKLNHRFVSNLPLLCLFTLLYHLKIWLLFMSSCSCPCVLSIHLRLFEWTKRITVTLAAKSCLAGINRGTCKQKQDGTDVFCWSFLLVSWSDPQHMQRDTETTLNSNKNVLHRSPELKMKSQKLFSLQRSKNWVKAEHWRLLKNDFKEIIKQMVMDF